MARKTRSSARQRSKSVVFHGFSSEEVSASFELSKEHRRSSLENVSHGYLLFDSEILPCSPSSSKSSSSPGIINIFTDNLLCSGKRAWKPTEKAQSAFPRSGLFQHSQEKRRASKEEPRLPSKKPRGCQTSRIPESRDGFTLSEAFIQDLHQTKEQITFMTSLQGSLSSSDVRLPPLLLSSSTHQSINPVGAALIHASGCRMKRRSGSSLPGNIICGICGGISFFHSVFKAKSRGTFSCEPCRTFISSWLQRLKNHQDKSVQCEQKTGSCVILTASDKTPCEGCWLKLCLLGYQLDDSLHNQLRSKLPKDIYHKLKEPLPAENPLLPHRGKVLNIQNGTLLLKPLFQGFGKLPVPFSPPQQHTVSSSSKEYTHSLTPKSSLSHVINIRLPNNWTKKASKVLSGERKGEWDVHLITPDHRILKNKEELDLYIIESGSLVDSHVVNFSLPQSAISESKKNMSTIDRSKVFASRDCSQIEDEVFCSNDAASGLQDCVLSSTIKVPVKRKLSSEDEHEPTSPSSPKVQKAEATEIASPLSRIEAANEKSPVFAKKSASHHHAKDIFSTGPIFAKKSAVFVPDQPTDRSPEVFAKKSTPTSLPQPKEAVPELVTPSKKSSSDKPQLEKEVPRPLDISKMKIESSVGVEGRNGEESSSSLALNRNRRREKRIPLKFRDSESVFLKGSQKDVTADKSRMVPVVLKKIDATQSDSCIMDNNSKNLSIAKPPSSPCLGCKAEDCRSCAKKACSKTLIDTTVPALKEPPPVTKKQLPKDDSKLDVAKDTALLLARLSYFKDPLVPSKEGSNAQRIIKPVQTNGKPKLSYSSLIAISLINFPGQRGTLSMVYEYIMQKFPYYKSVDKSGWQNSIRHNLSLNKCFVRTERTDKDGNGKGSFWIFDPDKVKNGSIKNFEKLMQSEELFLESESVKENVESGVGGDISEQIELPSSPGIMYRDILDSEFEVKDSPSKSSVRQQALMGSIDYWEPYDLDRVMKNGVGVLSVGKSPHEAICFLCGSAGKDSVFIHCCVCCEPFHPFCVDPGDAPNTDEEDEWVCRRCAVCQTCGQPEGNQLKCKVCRHAYHEDCLQEYQRKFLKEGHPWVCSHCLKCDSCGKSDVSHYSEGLPLCAICCRQKSKGSFCPLCKACYEDDDYDSRMMECLQCGAWVHAACEDLDVEKYQVLGSLPNSIDYVCKCDIPILSPKKLIRRKNCLQKDLEEEQQTELLTLQSLAPSSSRLSPASTAAIAATTTIGNQPHSNDEDDNNRSCSKSKILEEGGKLEELFHSLDIPQDEFALNNTF